MVNRYIFSELKSENRNRLHGFPPNLFEGFVFAIFSYDYFLPVYCQIYVNVAWSKIILNEQRNTQNRK